MLLPQAFNWSKIICTSIIMWAATFTGKSISENDTGSISREMAHFSQIIPFHARPDPRISNSLWTKHVCAHHGWECFHSPRGSSRSQQGGSSGGSSTRRRSCIFTRPLTLSKYLSYSQAAGRIGTDVGPDQCSLGFSATNFFKQYPTKSDEWATVGDWWTCVCDWQWLGRQIWQCYTSRRRSERDASRGDFHAIVLDLT